MAASPSANVVNGVVTFDPTNVGGSEMLEIDFQDTADVTETITSASISGADASAFQVYTTFPSTVPAGTQVMVEIQFTPDPLGPLVGHPDPRDPGDGPLPHPAPGRGPVAAITPPACPRPR